MAAASAADFLPPEHDLAHLRAAAAGCRGCELYARATQTVFGAGARDAALMLVGEQPGDQEDERGEPFIGPAGGVLSRAMAAAELDRDQAYVTNAVKHFKWEPRGKRRLHKKPSLREIRACQPWLDAELEAVRPRVLVCLGVTAATSVFGRAVTLRDYRGRFWASPRSDSTFVTVHPSALLRLPGPDDYEREFQHFVEDLRRVRERLAG